MTNTKKQLKTKKTDVERDRERERELRKQLGSAGR